MARITTAKLKIVVAPDVLSALVVLPKSTDPAELALETVLAALKDAGVQDTDEIRANVERVCQDAAGGKITGREIQVAEGRPPIPPIDARLELADAVKHRSDTPPEQNAEDAGDRIDYYAQCRLAIVEEGEAFGAMVPTVAGADGVDVFGKVIRQKETARELMTGEGVIVADDGATLVAAHGGLVRVNHDTVIVTDVVKIDGDVDLDSGSLDVTSDIVVKGTVNEMFSVKTTRSLSVGGAIEKCTVVAGGDVAVRGGIAGKDEGSVTAEGSIVCKFADAVTMRAGGDIVITREAINAHLMTQSRLVIPRGSLVGGESRARGGAEIREIGTDADVPTRVTIGLDPVILARVAKLDADVAKRHESAEKIRTTVGPLMADLKRLAPAQRERATELMFQADEMEAGAQDLLDRRKTMIEEGSWHEEPALLVSDVIHAGTTLIFEDLEYVAREPIKGPVKIFKRRAQDGVPSGLICVNGLSGSRRELFCRKYEAPLPPDDSEEATPAGDAENAAP